MKVAMANDYQFAHNTISLASKMYWGQRSKSSNPRFWSKFRAMEKWLLRDLRQENTIAVWYLNQNERINDFWHHCGLQQPQNIMFKFRWARAKSTQSSLNRSVDFNGDLSDKIRSKSESRQNLEVLELLVTIFHMII